MARPSLRVEIAFTTDPTEAPSWVDVTSYVRPPLRIRRGRQRELDQIQCGTAELVLDNRDSRFDPLYSGGPYYGYLKPLRRVRVMAYLSYDDLPVALRNEAFPDYGDAGGGSLTGWWHLFNGFVESWDPETFVDEARDYVMHVRAVDGFEPLARAIINDDLVEQLSGARIGAVLTLANWTTGVSWVVGSATNGVVGTMGVGPQGDRALADGSSTITAQEIEQTSALQHCLDVTQAEGGWFFMSKGGVATFYDRHRLIKEPFNEELCSFGTVGSDTGYEYTRVRASYGCEWIYNRVIMQTVDGDEQVVEDTSSKNAYLLRTLQQTNLPLTDDGEALSRARFMLDRYKEPRIRFDSLEFEGDIPAAVWEPLLAMDLGEMIRVKHLAPGASVGTHWDQSSIIQGIEHEIGERDWRVSWWLAPHHTGEFWLVGVAKVGAADMRPAW